jgi:hypothetical protein
LTIGHIAKNLSHNETPAGDVFFNDITKLLTAVVADVAVLVCTTLPEGQRGMGQIEGIWVCEPIYAPALATALRDGIIATAMQRSARFASPCPAFPPADCAACWTEIAV